MTHSNHSQEIGRLPGELVYVGPKQKFKSTITSLHYTSRSVEEAMITRSTLPRAHPTKKTWIDVHGIHDTQTIKAIGERFDLHPLVLEDIVNTTQPIKIEDFGSYLFVVLKALVFNTTTHTTQTRQISFILTNNCIISFQEGPEDFLKPVRDRIKENSGIIRSMGIDYLLYALSDIITDNYFLAIQKIGEAIEKTEETILDDPTPECLHNVHSLKQELLRMRKVLWPTREVMHTIGSVKYTLINKKTEAYFRDIYDHLIQMIDTIETNRDVISGLTDVYLSTVSNRMNEVMKTLTIFASIFIPLTFLTGIYGMNFTHMPELDWQYGYYVILGIMITLGLFMLRYFKKKKWL